ncbi:sulfatase-like hydrolase/transferase [Moraxella canis]|uniref:sulfatase-like hydrolase/transferase n=1 Tax=Moraxella canis TaxID=90239 RepID=UPI0012FEC395|nr:sulfatase-like hydrolase/transferase [Moraxella canis]
MTGTDPHNVGLGNIYELNTPEQSQAPNYVGHLTDNSLTVAQRLQQAGYYTVLSGKWHLGKRAQDMPNHWGFDDAFALLNGEANNYRHTDGYASPDGLDMYSYNGRGVMLPEGVFATDFYTDFLLDKLSSKQANNPNQPFFAFLAYTAPHSPLQAPDADIAKYQGYYHDGPQVLAERRLANLKQIGLVAQEVEPHPLVNVKPWDSLRDDEKATESKRMQLYAAMVDNMDQNIGRVFNHLKANNQYDNTVIIFFSDNGAAGASREASQRWGGWIRDNRNNSFANMGKADSYISTGPSWAQASMTPFALYKGYTTDGAIRSPLIIKGSGVAQGVIEGRFANLTDLAPTILDFAQLSKDTPADKSPLQGNSLIANLATPNAQVVGVSTPVAFEMRGNRQVRMGNYKATYLGTLPYGIPPVMLPAGYWQLFDIVADPGETNNIASENPQILAQMIDIYKTYSAEVGVVELFDVDSPQP